MISSPDLRGRGRCESLWLNDNHITHTGAGQLAEASGLEPHAPSPGPKPVPWPGIVIVLD